MKYLKINLKVFILGIFLQFTPHNTNASSTALINASIIMNAVYGVREWVANKHINNYVYTVANKENFTEEEYQHHSKMITAQINKINKSWSLTMTQKAKVLDRLAAVQQSLDVKKQLHINRNPGKH